MNTTLKRISLTLSLLFILSTATNNVFAWDSKESGSVESTHTLLAEQGLNILLNDLSDSDKQNQDFMNILKDLKNDYLGDFRQGSVAPDFSKDAYELYQDHFYDPDTKVNFSAFRDVELTALDYVNPTAESRTREYVANAVYLWKIGKKSEAAFNLGYAMHYFTDLCEPQHASNAISATREPFTKHFAFEKYVENKKENYRISTLGNTTDSNSYQDVLSYEYLSDFLNKESNMRSSIAKSSYMNEFKIKDLTTWESVAIKTTSLSQEGVARVLYRFAKEVSNSATPSTNDTTLDVRIKTKSGKITDCYGTDNSVFFGVELKDGRLMEYYLDKPRYNDFENGDNDTYQVTLKGAQASDIRKIYIRKERGWTDSSPEDNWFPEEIQVTSKDGQFNYLKSINRWLNGNNGYYININKDAMELLPNY